MPTASLPPALVFDPQFNPSVAFTAILPGLSASTYPGGATSLLANYRCVARLLSERTCSRAAMAVFQALALLAVVHMQGLVRAGTPASQPCYTLPLADTL